MATVKQYNEDDAQTKNHVEILRYEKPNDKSIILTNITVSAWTSDKTHTWIPLVDKEELTEQEALKIAQDFIEGMEEIDLILKKY